LKEVIPSPRAFRFGAFELDLRAGELRKQGRKIRLQGQPIEILAMLLEHPCEVVTREELQRKLWPADTFVDFEQGLNAAIKRLRAALDDDAERPRFIETLPRHGYRFIGQVDGSDGALAGVSSPAQDTTVTRRVVSALVEAVLETRRSRARWRVWAVATAIAAVALVAALVGLNVRGVRDRLFGKPAAARIHAIAVLPLQNLSDDPEQEYFADGMTDALITELGKLSALRVISRQSVMRYKGSQKPAHEIARELQVDALVEGSVQRSGDRVRVSANLIEASTDQHLWAEMYDRDLRDILTVQGNFAQAIAREVQVKLTPQQQLRLASASRISPEAYQLYLRGRYFMARTNEASVRKSIAYFQQAIEKDPTYAAAYAGLGNAYRELAYFGAVPPEEGYSGLKTAVTKAVELDETLGEAHEVLGYYNLYYLWDGKQAEQEFKRAIELNPNYPDAHTGYADYLGQTGRFDEAITEKKRALELDPLAPVFSGELAWMFLWARRYDDAIEQFQKTLELDPNGFDVHNGMSFAYLQKGMLREAMAEAEKAQALWRKPQQPKPFLGYVHARAGKKKKHERSSTC